MSELHVRTTLPASGPATAIVLTDEQVAELGTARSAPVTVTIGDRTARLRLTRMGGENLIGLSKASRAELGVEIGDTVDAVIAPDTAERAIDVPEALASALASDPALQQAFDALAPSRRKEMARQIADAKQEATHERRLAKILDELR